MRLAGSDAPARVTPTVSSTATAGRASAGRRRRLGDEVSEPGGRRRGLAHPSTRLSSLEGPPIRFGSLGTGAPRVASSGWPIAAMNRCLMNTQSSGGFTVGADSSTLATMTHGPGSVRERAMAARKGVRRS